MEAGRVSPNKNIPLSGLQEIFSIIIICKAPCACYDELLTYRENKAIKCFGTIVKVVNCDL